MNENYTFYKMPKFLFNEALALSSPAKILFTLMLERKRASEAVGTPYIDEEGKSFILFTYENAARLLGCHKSTVGIYIKELKDNGLLTTKADNFKSRIYLHFPYGSEFTDTENPNDTDRKSRTARIGNPEPNKNIINKNSFNKNAAQKKKSDAESNKPSYDLDVFTRKAFRNPMLIYEKKESKSAPTE